MKSETRTGRGGTRRDRRGRPREATAGLLRTAEVLRRARITHQTLYRYVTAGLIEPALVTESGQRWFRPEVVALIRIIRDFTQGSYTLRDLKDTFFQDKNVQRLLARQRGEEAPKSSVSS